ncbi:MAG: response regulator [Chloroflexota bacterium]
MTALGDDPALDAARARRHELRTPLNHVLSYARLVAEEAEELHLDRLSAAMADIRQAGARALQLVDTILTDDAAGEVVAAARGALHSLAREIARSATVHAPDVPGSIRDDLGRISAAADRLVALFDDDATGSVAEPTARRPATAADSTAAGSARLLVVDDNEENRDVLSRTLHRLGYAAERAENGRQALEVLGRSEIDLVLLDIMMPELDGYQVLERRRADARLRNIPFIMISAADDAASVVRCIEMGAEDYLPKPFDPVLLRARIGACLEKKRLHDQERANLAIIEKQAAELAEWNRALEQRVAAQVAELERVGRLQRFLPSQVARMIVESGDDSILTSHRRNVSVVFCDLRGFTAFSETAEPELVLDVLDGYHRTIGELISRHGGTVEHFAGDGVMVLFNDPVACDEPERRAVLMALEMRQRMGELCAGWRGLGHELGFGVGIAVGYATLGQIGFESRLHYAAIGSPVNLAARLCDQAADGQILVSRRVAAAVECEVAVRALGELRLKGLRDPAVVFDVIGDVIGGVAGPIGVS